ncbi:MAG TPA: hypothetical protein GX010_02845 [Erysipelotrichaceae bacterium]|nr:hypothetical protein [Erysipelotrichaceae bacterium]
MKPRFIIDKLGAENRSPNVDTYLKKEHLDDICSRVLGHKNYDVKWREKKIKGRLIYLETSDCIYYINLSQNGHLRGRDYQVQSIPTALGIYLSDQKKNNASELKDRKKLMFYFYFMPQTGNNNTRYVNFFYRCMKTADIKILNADFGLPGETIEAFSTIKEIIKTRNESREINSGNQSTYITDEGNCYHIYGKTFGANQKETTLLCIAISALTDKPVKLFQILDNDSTQISQNDIDAIKTYVDMLPEKKSFEIMDDTLQFDDDSSDTITDRLRSPKFIYNLLSKYGGEKRCILCGCKIDSIIQAAHIYPVASIRKRKDLDDDIKFSLAIDKDNGIWLCENHHKLFDKNIIWFEEGKLCVSKSIDDEDVAFVKQITTIDEIEPHYINERMLAFFDMRAGIPPRVVL